MKYNKSPNQIIQELRSKRRNQINVRKKNPTAVRNGQNNNTTPNRNPQNVLFSLY